MQKHIENKFLHKGWREYGLVGGLLLGLWLFHFKKVIWKQARDLGKSIIKKWGAWALSRWACGALTDRQEITFSGTQGSISDYSPGGLVIIVRQTHPYFAVSYLHGHQEAYCHPKSHQFLVCILFLFLWYICKMRSLALILTSSFSRFLHFFFGTSQKQHLALTLQH